MAQNQIAAFCALQNSTSLRLLAKINYLIGLRTLYIRQKIVCNVTG